ncbi:hypothetical protein Bca52824_022693 [Brassica carinata]|uniref:F-box associated beta-propeller type 3 domain-containing protein n=1 Tax=Brassica carinata TaxID=52824 RepID=A0A8X7VH59_BRACI|nr:hypothetical protein Bca52824_022693 [Brassica carinata]
MEDSQVPLSPPPRRKQDHDDNSTTDIPYDLILDILSRLQQNPSCDSNPCRSCEPIERFILSAPEHNNKEDDRSVTLRHDMTISHPVYYTMSPPVNGMVCCIFDSSITVCNPTTRQSVKLPDVRPNGGCIHPRLGYDPVKDQYKVLCVIVCNPRNPYQQDIQPEHFVCTVRSSEKQEWRKIENTTVGHYHTVIGGICIDDAIYILRSWTVTDS